MQHYAHARSNNIRKKARYIRDYVVFYTNNSQQQSFVCSCCKRHHSHV
ncbi:hypothetical protein HMPREF3190_01211 [Umbribacter vaginalis]|nr:hypothetical protein HMPREF3190_01211 [Coriobacteriales bacterium DNF00809]